MGYSSLLETILREVPKRRIFVSYHHSSDQAYYDAFSLLYTQARYDVIKDNSLRDARDSDDPQYIMQSIRDNNIEGTSCTIVLVGVHTYGRKYVDWEIKGTLDKEHGLIGVRLPTAPVKHATNLVIVPGRLHANISSRYALWITWQHLMSGPEALKVHIENALNTTTRPKTLIVNDPQLMRRNTSG